MAKMFDVEIEEVLAVSFDDFNKFLAEKNAEQRCEACGYEGEWYMRTNGASPHLVQTLLFRDPSQLELNFALNCANCGSSRFFNATFVVNELKRMRSAENGEG